jgi:tetratricopeptide (TPR) repeat protein
MILWKIMISGGSKKVKKRNQMKINMNKILLTIKNVCPFICMVKNLSCSIYDHTNLFKRISMGSIAGGLIFKGLSNCLLITAGYSTLASGRKPLKIRPLPTLGGISFEISSFKDRHDLQLLNSIHNLLNFKKILLSTLIIILIAPFAWGKEIVLKSEDQMAFALQYMEKGEYDKAVLEFERFIYFFPDDEDVPIARYRIGQCYVNAKKYSLARKTLEKLYVDSSQTSTGEKALFLIGESYYMEGMLNEAEICFKKLIEDYPSSEMKDKALYRIAWIRLSSEQWEEASRLFKTMEKDSPLYSPSLDLSERLLEGAKLPHKNPKLAGILAGVIPGLGHAYCGRYRDGTIALTLNGLFIWAAVEAFENDNDVLGGILSFLEVGWYTGNIYSAVNCAHKYNRKQKNDFILKLNDSININLFSGGRNRLGVAFNIDF